MAGRRRLALDLWLLLHAAAAAEPWDVTLPAMVWGRTLGLAGTAASETTISRNWSWLEEHRLVRSERERRMRKVILLREDGSGRPFERASGKERGFFRLPYAYFRKGWNRALRLPGKATLLICLAQRPTFSLRTEHASGWYGVSADTLQRGLDELRDLGLLQVWQRPKTAPLARYGITYENFCRLQGPFVRAPKRARGSRRRSKRRRRPRPLVPAADPRLLSYWSAGPGIPVQRRLPIVRECQVAKARAVPPGLRISGLKSAR